MTEADMITMLESLENPELSALSVLLGREKTRRLRDAGADGSLLDEEIAMLGSRNLIGVVNSIRERTGLGLRDAKDYMDRARDVLARKV